MEGRNSCSLAVFEQKSIRTETSNNYYDYCGNYGVRDCKDNVPDESVGCVELVMK